MENFHPARRKGAEIRIEALRFGKRLVGRMSVGGGTHSDQKRAEQEILGEVSWSGVQDTGKLFARRQQA
jgi:hypothetical protein